MRFANILSTGRYVPKKVITNADLDAFLGEAVGDWLVKNVGIEQRHVMADDETTSDLAVYAARQAIERAEIQPEDLDLIILATDTPDYISPATSSVVQAKLGAINAGTFDINCACAAWVTALDQGARYIATDTDYNYILVVAGYGMSRYLDWHDKYTGTVFADGAGAVVLGASEKPGFLASKLKAFGEFHDALGIYTGGVNRPATLETVKADGPPTVRFVRKFPNTFNIDYWPGMIRDSLKKADLSVADVDWFLFTQINLPSIEAMMDILEQPMSKTHWIMDKWGYTGSACIPMALDDLVVEGKGPKLGDTIVFCASGGGISFAVSVWQWTAGE